MSTGNVTVQPASTRITRTPDDQEAHLYEVHQTATLLCGDVADSNSQNVYGAECWQECDVTVSNDRRDRGWWLLLDCRVPHSRWSELAKLDAKLIAVGKLRCQEVSASWLKRALDCTVALALLILMMPVWAVIAMVIKMESFGPALFCHKRVGKDGEEFDMWKFRSMHTDADRYERSPNSSRDPRLTRVGRVIRRISLDEIPQLWNVLRGEMSLVGPRPEMAFIVDSYDEVLRKRLGVRPGITGLWQISNYRSEPIHHNAQLDLYYIQNHNVMLDVAIILRTISAVIRGVGA